LARRQNATKSTSLAAAIDPAAQTRRASGLLEQSHAREAAAASRMMEASNASPA